MDPERQRIQDDLRGALAGEVRCDDPFLQLYATDASIFEIKPLGVVRPRHRDDVVACARYASENHIPIHARGAGTGLAGESLGPGLVLDFSYYMRRILAVDGDVVRIQPGVVHANLNNYLEQFGRQFGPDPANSQVTTMGSVVALDAGGSHWPRFGSARPHVQSLQVVLADGATLDVARHALIDSDSWTDLLDDQNGGGSPGSTGSGGSSPGDRSGDRGGQLAGQVRRQRLLHHLARLVQDNSELIQQHMAKSPVNRSGYHLHGLIDDGKFDLARLLVGSEGTLALFTELTLATQPLAPHRGVVLMWFESIEQAAQAVQALLPAGPSACDLMDRRHLSLARESDVRYELMIPSGAEAALLVEQDGESLAEVRDRLADVVDRVQRKKRLPAAVNSLLDPEEVALCWNLARKYVPTLYGMKGSTRPAPFVEDIAVPPEVLPDFLVRVQNVLKRHQTIASIFGHAIQGQLHLRPFLDLSQPEFVQKMQQIAEDLYAEVIDVGGTISGEHADGLSRTPFIAMQYGPLCDVFREVKRRFDPDGILNPGKIVSAEPARLARHLRNLSLPEKPAGAGDSSDALAAAAVAAAGAAPNGSGAAVVDLQLAWSREEALLATRQCNGCGVCRAQSDEVRMCPIFRLAPGEEASPRSKANLLRGLLTGRLDQTLWEHDDFKAIADLCVHCHQCRLECPANVDIPKLMVEAKGAYVEANGLRPSDWFMSRIDLVSRLASRWPRLANWALGNRVLRWLMEKTTGLAQGRRLPTVAKRSFLNIAARRRWTQTSRRSGPKVLYFVDTYANYFDPELAEALAAVFEHNGVAVFAPPGQKAAAMPLVAAGALEKARQIAAHNVAILAEGVRQGYTIVTTEPSAALCLTREYPMLLNDEDARQVAAHSMDACHYLWRLHQQGTLELDFKPQPMTLGYHAPCHLKALGVGLPGVNLLRLIPGLTVRQIEKGCSGMAGTYGLKRENFRNSLRAGWGVISALREERLHSSATECSTCKMQIEQGTGKPAVHPLKLLALAYGLMPQIAQHISHLPSTPAPS